MDNEFYVPISVRDAEAQLCLTQTTPIDQLSKSAFVRAWSSIAYLFPNLHPDYFEDAEGGWPSDLHDIAVEAWQRANDGDLNEYELYPSDAHWAGLYNRMNSHTPDESWRRQEIASASMGSIGV